MLREEGERLLLDAYETTVERKNPLPQPTTSERFVDSVQHARFLEIARTLEYNEDKAAFDEKLKAVVGPKAGLELIGEP